MDPELKKEAAWLWERMVADGIEKDEATRRVQSWLAAPVSGTEERGDRPGVVGGTGASLAQGVTLGTSDELYGGVRALAAMVPGGKSPAQAYTEGASGSREYLSEFGEDHPVLRTGADIIGGLGTAVATGGLGLAGRGAVTAGRLARLGAIEGMVVGGIEGAARAEGGLVERGTAGAIGAGLGGVFGGAVGAATPILSRAGATGAGALVGGGVGYAVGGDPVDAGIGAAGGATAGRLGSRLAGRIAQRIGPSPAGERAAEAASRALGREGVSPEQLARVAAEAPETNLLELTGRVGSESPVQRLARGAQSFPSRGSRELTGFLNETSDAAPDRIRAALRARSGTKGGNIYETLEEMDVRQQAASRPLYDKAYEQSVPRSVLGNIDMVRDPVWRDAYERGIRIAQREGEDIRAIAPELIEGAPFAADVQIPVQAIDYMKRGLDDLIGQRFSSASGMANQEGRALRRQLNEVLDRVDEAVPEFGQARATWGGHERIQELTRAAVEGGTFRLRPPPGSGMRGGEVTLRRFTQESPAKLEYAMRRMSPSEVEAYRRSAIEDVMAMLSRREDTSADLARLLIGRSGGEATETDLRRRLRLLFDNDRDMQEFVRTMLDERAKAGTGNFILGNSATQRIAAEQADLASQPITSLDPRQLTLDALRNRVGRYLMRLDEETVDALAPILTRPIPETAPLIERGLDQYGRRLLTRSATAGRAGAAQGGAAVGVLSNDERAKR